MLLMGFVIPSRYYTTLLFGAMVFFGALVWANSIKFSVVRFLFIRSSGFGLLDLSRIYSTIFNIICLWLISKQDKNLGKTLAHQTRATKDCASELLCVSNLKIVYAESTLNTFYRTSLVSQPGMAGHWLQKGPGRHKRVLGTFICSDKIT